MKILIIGAGGRLGKRVVHFLEQQGHIVASSTEDDLDMTNYGAVMDRVRGESPSLVVNCAAMTDVDRCALYPDEANLINGIGTQIIALACQRYDAALCHISTNEVFDGERSQPYLEYDTPRPINAYGYSKWLGEQFVRDLLTRFYIVRTSWLFAHGGVNFLQKIYAAAQAGKPLSVVTDEIAAPTYNEDLAVAIAALVGTQRYGIYHLLNDGSASRYEFARHALDCYGMQDYPIAPISSAQFSRPSKPPACAILRNFVGAAAGIVLRDWKSAVAAFVEQETQGTRRS